MYYLPLKYAHRLGVEIMTKEEFGKIFYGFETIYQLNEKFLHDLEENKANNTISTTIGQLFKLYVRSVIFQS
jgi:translation initiation factor 2 alpha subunit (eIF-2alpha)